ncbi:MAG: alpha/beta hydrolase family protein [Butyricicoccus sp.]
MMKQIHYPSRGKEIYGFAHIPETMSPGPALILCHGFTGSAYEGSRLFVHLANAACAQGICVLRIDFLGSGNSDADFAEHTYLSGWVEDVLAGADFLSVQPEVDPSRIGVLGISFGAAAAMLAGQDPRLKAVGGWASVIHPEATFRGIFTDEKWEYLAQGGCRIDHVYAGTHFSVMGKFVEDIKTLSIPDAVRQYGEKPLLLMQGDQDTVIDTAHSAALAASVSCPVEYHFIEGEDHSFLNHMEENISITLDFFRRNL